MSSLMNSLTKKILEQVASWPEQDQKELAEVAREIEARRTGMYYATPEELQSIDEGFSQLDRGEVASLHRQRSFLWSKPGGGISRRPSRRIFLTPGTLALFGDQPLRSVLAWG